MWLSTSRPTFPEQISVRDFELGETDDSHAAGCWQMSLGYVKVRSRVVGFKTMERDEVIAVHQLDLPPIELDTRGLWMSPLRPLHTLLSPGRDLLGSLHAAEHALIHAMPLLAMCDRGDAGGISTLTGPGNSEPLMLLHDAYEGGAGTVDESFHSFRVLAGLTLEMIESCDCGSAGCHRCCYSRLCGSDNEPMDRLGAIHLLKSLLENRYSPSWPYLANRISTPSWRARTRGAAATVSLHGTALTLGDESSNPRRCDGREPDVGIAPASAARFTP